MKTFAPPLRTAAAVDDDIDNDDAIAEIDVRSSIAEQVFLDLDVASLAGTTVVGDNVSIVRIVGVVAKITEVIVREDKKIVIVRGDEETVDGDLEAIDTSIIDVGAAKTPSSEVACCLL